jgi:hypothetical protein
MEILQTQILKKINQQNEPGINTNDLEMQFETLRRNTEQQINYQKQSFGLTSTQKLLQAKGQR